MVYETDGKEQLFRGHIGGLFLLLTFILISIKVGQRLIPPLLPTIIDDLGITAFLAGVALTVFRIARASVEYPGGRVADQHSRTSVIIICLALVALGLSILAFSDQFAVFLVGIIVFGIGIGLFNPPSRALISDLFVEKRGKAFGLHMMGSGIAGIIAAGVAIWFVTVASWREAFLLIFVLVLPFPLILYLFSRESLSIGRIDLELFKTGSRLKNDETIRLVIIVYALNVFANSGVTNFLPTFLIDVHQMSFMAASGSFALFYAVGIVAKPVGGTVSDIVPRQIVAGGCLMLSFGGIFVMVGAPTQAIVFLGVIIYAIGNRGLAPVLQAYLMDRFPEQSRGGDLGASRTVYVLFGSLGPAYLGFMASSFSFELAYASIIIPLMLATVLILKLSR